MRIETWVQVAPISLPRLKQGRNELRYDIGDRYDKATMPAFVQPNVADPDDLRKYVVDVPEDYDLKRKTARIRGDVVLKLEAPEGTTIDWFTAGACFTTHQNKGAKNTRNRMAYALGEPHDFIEIYRADVPTWVNHWRYQQDIDVRLSEPARRVFVKYTGDPAVNVLRATLHLKPKSTPERAIQVTHGYAIDGELIEKKIDLRESGDYTIDVEGTPENVFIRMAVPSRSSGKEQP